MDEKRLLKDLFAAAIAAVDARGSVKNALQDRDFKRPVELVALGKAAIGMSRGAIDTLGDRIGGGLIVAESGCADPGCLRDRFECREGGHPLPDQASIDAGERLIEFMHEGAFAADMLFLISGGASALVEAPVQGVSLDDLVRLNRWLLGSGLDIGAVNTVRKRVSRLKGCGLSRMLGGRRAVALYISDVAGDRVADIASAPLGPVDERPLPPLPAWIQVLLDSADPPAPPRPDANIERRIVARLDDALAGAAAKARESGFDAFVHEQRLEGEAQRVGAFIARELLQAKTGVHIWGGETVVHLPINPGRGGRSQSLALAAAIELARAGGGRKIGLLAAGTDGIDGVGDAAGAIVDANTIERGEAAGYGAQKALARADAGTFLDACGSLLRTGPTGTNVTDVVIALKADAT